jgi:hypothetical protein
MRVNGVAPLEDAVPVYSRALASKATINTGPTSRIPAFVQVLLVTIISFSTSFVLFSVGNGFTKNELAAVSRQPENFEDLLLFPALRIAELALGWYTGFDGVLSSTRTFRMGD